MSDPAVEAANRAEAASGWWKSGGSTPWDSGYATDSAREALKPIRELHVPVVYGPDITDETWVECKSCRAEEWPCATALLVHACTCSAPDYQDEHCPLHGRQATSNWNGSAEVSAQRADERDRNQYTGYREAWGEADE